MLPQLKVLDKLFAIQLNKLIREIESYSNEGNLWIVDHGINNSGGNICLHLVGNLNTYICAIYGETGYVRDRPFEFAGRDVPRPELIQSIEQLTKDLNKSLDKINQEQMIEDFPILIFEEKTSTAYMLTHLAAHLTYHLGQINYHRRLLDK